MKAYILQPGKLGDLIVTIPIAEHYKKIGYEIHWFVYDNFKNFFKYFDFVHPIGMDYSIKNYYSDKRNNLNSNLEMSETQNFYYKCYVLYEQLKQENDILLDISWGFIGSPLRNNAMIQVFNSKNKNWIDMRYDIAQVSLKERWNFKWNRDEKKENDLLEFIKNFSKKKYGSETYSICHNYSNNKNNIKLNNQINFSYVKGYEIFDWYKVLLNAEAIACVDSSLCNFVEVIPELKNKKKYYLGSEEPHYFNFMRNILFNNWLDLDNKLIVSDYTGKV